MFNLWKKKTITKSGSDVPAVVFCNLLLQKSRETFGDGRVRDILRAVFESRKMPVGVEEDSLLVGSGISQDAIKAIVIGIVNETVKVFGTVATENMLMSAISDQEGGSSTEAGTAEVMAIVPAGFLESRKIKFLSKEELERQVAEKTSELRKVNDVLEDKVAKRTEELRKLLAEQERSGKLLVRRDLELTHANDKLRELDERKSEFLSVVAHQLRTPLSGIKWTLSMIMNGELGPVSNDQKVFIMKSYESNDRMIELVEDMLHADRVDSGKYDLNLVKTQIFDLIDNVLYEILPAALRREVKIGFKRREELPQLNIDQEKMRAVFQNLFDNAVKYSRRGGTISVDITKSADFVQVAISDSGVGIPEDQKSLIFSRFFRARNALKVETDGNGLGLFIVKSIIEMHGGRIWFESEENVGTTFYFTIKI